MRTGIRGKWVVGYDAAAGRHYLLEHGVVVVDGKDVVHVGRELDAPVDREIQAPQHLVAPGFINTHVHAGIEAIAGLQDLPSSDGPAWIGASELAVAGERSYHLTDDEMRTHMEFGILHMLKTGCTTFLDVIGSSTPWWLGNTPRDVEIFVEVAGRLGARVYSTPGYRSFRTFVDANGRRGYSRRDDEGFAHLERAAAFIEKHHGSFDGRVLGMLYPHAVDNMSPELLRATRKAADALGVGIQIHAAQSIAEVEATGSWYGRSPIELLDDTGVLGPDTILGHCIFINTHSMINRPGDDLRLLADSKTSVAHSPLKFLYAGFVMESFQRYVDRGVNVTIGTDSFPSDFLLEMRAASMAGKLIDRRGSVARTEALFDAATLGGAKALRRTDIGRLAPGARADIMVVDVSNLDTGLVFDPIKALVHYCTAKDIDTVMIDGRVVIDRHRSVDVDEEDLLKRAAPIYERLRGVLAARNWNRSTTAEMFPFCLPAR